MFKTTKSSKYIISIFFIILFVLLKSFSNCQSNTLPIKSKNDPLNFINITDLIKNKTDIFFISTKDGYLHALSKEQKELWKIYLGRELISYPESILKIDENLFLYPFNEKLYIYKNGQLFSFQLFIKDLVKKQYININDFLLIGKTKTTVFIIDIETGEILTNSDNDNNLISKKRYITQSAKKKTITVLRIDYILSCLGIESEQKYWDVSYSDVVIQRGNEDSNYIKLKNPLNTMKELIIDYNNNLNLDDITTVYSFFHDSDLKLVKIFDRSKLNKYFDESNKKKLNGEIKNLTKYKHENKNENVDADKRLQAFQEINNFGEWRFILSSEKKEEINQIKNYEYIIIIIFLIFIIFLLSFRTLSEKIISYFFKNKKESISQINRSINNNIINDYNNYEIDNKIIADKLKTRKATEGRVIISKKKLNKTRNLTEKITSKIKIDTTKNNNIRHQNFLSIEDSSSIKNNESNNTKKNKSNESSSEEKSLSNNNHESIAEKITHQEGPGIWDDDETLKSNNIKKIQENSKKTKGIWDEDDEDEEKTESNNKITESNKINEKTLDDDETSNGIKKIKEKSKIKNGIWDNDDDEDEKNETINNNINESNTINEKSEISFSNKSIYNNNFISQKVKEKNICRLDQDFESLEKIGQGGFGIVLKGKHLLDKGIWAIKIIKLSNLENKDDIINEAVTMMNNDSKYVVQYKTCWIEKNLGSAAKFFTIGESDSNISESINSLTKSVNINLNTNKKFDNNFIINEKSKNDNNKKSKKNSKKKVNYKNYNKKNINFDNCSNNSEKNKQKNKKTKYCVDYIDDSRFISKSIISSKYINENYENDNEYFFILMEYCDGLSLSEYISQNAGKSIDRKIIYYFIKQILKGLKKIHNNGIIHRDIKPQNIFIKNNLIKIGDFGLATCHFKNSKPLQTKDLTGFTPTYASPEQNCGKTYNEKIDIYASGITLYEMCGCFETFMERDESINNLKNKRIICEQVSKNYPEESEIILMMTEKDYNIRPSAEEILNSELFVKLGNKLGVKKV